MARIIVIITYIFETISALMPVVNWIRARNLQKIKEEGEAFLATGSIFLVTAREALADRQLTPEETQEILDSIEILVDSITEFLKTSAGGRS